MLRHLLHPQASQQPGRMPRDSDTSCPATVIGHRFIGHWDWAICHFCEALWRLHDLSRERFSIDTILVLNIIAFE